MSLESFLESTRHFVRPCSHMVPFQDSTRPLDMVRGRFKLYICMSGLNSILYR